MKSVFKMGGFARPAFLALLCSVIAIGFAASQTPPHVPLVQMTDADGITRLNGWARAPVPHAENKIVPKGVFSGDARVLSIQSELGEFLPAIHESLELDETRSFRLSASEQLTGETVNLFKDATGMNGAAFYAWIGSAIHKGDSVQIAGFSIVTPQGPDKGAAAEMFIASPEAFEKLGGWVVPTVRYFGLQLNEPDADMTQFGAMSDQDAVTNMGRFFKEWMAQITVGKTMAVMGTVQTLGIQNGSDQAQDTGLQDPIFDVSN